MIFQNPGNIQTGECLNHSLCLGSCSLSVKGKIWGNKWTKIVSYLKWLDGQQGRHQAAETPILLISNQLTFFPPCSHKLSCIPANNHTGNSYFSKWLHMFSHCLICSYHERIYTISFFQKKASYSSNSTRRKKVTWLTMGRFPWNT